MSWTDPETRRPAQIAAMERLKLYANGDDVRLKTILLSSLELHPEDGRQFIQRYIDEFMDEMTIQELGPEVLGRGGRCKGSTRYLWSLVKEIRWDIYYAEKTTRWKDWMNYGESEWDVGRHKLQADCPEVREWMLEIEAVAKPIIDKSISYNETAKVAEEERLNNDAWFALTSDANYCQEYDLKGTLSLLKAREIEFDMKDTEENGRVVSTVMTASTGPRGAVQVVRLFRGISRCDAAIAAHQKESEQQFDRYD